MINEIIEGLHSSTSTFTQSKQSLPLNSQIYDSVSHSSLAITQYLNCQQLPPTTSSLSIKSSHSSQVENSKKSPINEIHPMKPNLNDSQYSM